ncbi:MAG TPA: ABC transporter substrate-binding protein [Acidimicrobiales bacterium]|nr:ABC transporter substrate-binding protein [Acidimicrobiales bacterium]
MPLFAAAASGLFAERGLRVELLDPLGGGPEGVSGVAEGRADFALTSVYYALEARRRAGGELPVRFVAVLHQRSPLAAFVAVDSPLRRPADLGGCRVSKSNAPWFDADYQAALARLGVEPAVMVGPDELGRRPSLDRGEVDVIGSWAEAVAVIRRRAGIPVRCIPFGPPIYTTGLVAPDQVRHDVVTRMAAALSEAVSQRCQRPDLGMEQLCERFPAVRPADAAEEWSILESYLLERRPAAMDADLWQDTLRYESDTHGFAHHPTRQVVREELMRLPPPQLSTFDQ